MPFHNSVFKIAQKAKVPIVIVGLDGTETIHKRTPWKKTVVKLEVLDVITAENVQNMRTSEIGEHTKNELIKWIDKDQGKENYEIHCTLQSSCG